LKQRLIGNRQLQHHFTLCGAGLRLWTVRRHIIRHNSDALQANLVCQNFDRFQMPVVDRVKGATKQSL